MDKYKVKINPQAQVQLSEIFGYIKEKLKESQTAINMLDELEKSIKSLETMPKRMSFVDEEPWQSYGVHKMMVKNFIVYFLVNDEHKEVQIIAVIYGRRDQLNRLNQMNI